VIKPCPFFFFYRDTEMFHISFPSRGPHGKKNSGGAFMLKGIVKEMTDESLNIIFVDALKREDEANARLASDELFDRMLKEELE
jgi:hypothetical protein